MARTLKYWNGCGSAVSSAADRMGICSHEDAVRGKIHTNVCAHSEDDALTLFKELGMRPPSKSFLRTYFSKCWGTDMAEVPRGERGIWISSRGGYGCPKGGPWKVEAPEAADA